MRMNMEMTLRMMMKMYVLLHSHKLYRCQQEFSAEKKKMGTLESGYFLMVFLCDILQGKGAGGLDDDDDEEEPDEDEDEEEP
jgi:hypothetical protein